MEVEFDPEKAIANERKHGITFEYSLRAFRDPRRLMLDASRVQDRETRSKHEGMIDGMAFTIVFTMRGDVTRLISARRSNRKEQEAYDHGAL